MRLARVLGALGRVLITAGVLILLFVAYQLWGTGIREAQAQNRLEDEFSELVDATSETTTPPTLAPAPSATTTSVADQPVEDTVSPAAPGDPIARIEIPAIGVDKIVVEGVSRSDLKKGPGHYPETPLPGQKGNAAIAGHRTTYGAPFHRVDELEPGDEIIVETVQGRFRYLVREQRIVEPTQVEVLADTGRNMLTLTACHPKYSARERIVIIADLAPGETVAPPTAPGDSRAPRCCCGRRPRRRGRLGVAGSPVRTALCGHLARCLARRSAVAEVACLPDRAAVLPGGTLLLLRRVQPLRPRELLSFDAEPEVRRRA